jgi:hypothetical protein
MILLSKFLEKKQKLCPYIFNVCVLFEIWNWSYQESHLKLSQKNYFFDS